MIPYRYHEEAAEEYHAEIRYYKGKSPSVARAFVLLVNPAIGPQDYKENHKADEYGGAAKMGTVHGSHLDLYL